MDRVSLHAVDGMIPRHGTVRRGAQKVIDPAASVISRAWTEANGGTRIPRLTDHYDALKRARDRAAAEGTDTADLDLRLQRHQCPTTFCPVYDPTNADPTKRTDAQQLCALVPGSNPIKYKSAVMGWQRALAEYCWGSRRSMLVAAQTGAGKTHIIAYVIQLMQFIDTGQGGFLGMNDRQTNIAVIVGNPNTVGGADKLRTEVFRLLTEFVGAEKVDALLIATREGGPGVPVPLHVVNSEDLLDNFSAPTWAQTKAGRLFFVAYPNKDDSKKNNNKTNEDEGQSIEYHTKAAAAKLRRWDTNMMSNFVVLDEVHLVPLVVLRGLQRARDQAVVERRANPATHVSSPTTLMLSATPCAGGVLHFANIMMALDNDDSGTEITPAGWIAEAKSKTDARLSTKNTRINTPDVTKLLKELGLTVRSVVRVGDTVSVAGGSVTHLFRVGDRSWDRSSCLELLRLDDVSIDPPVASTAWLPALLCLPHPTPEAYDVVLWLNVDGTLVITEKNIVDKTTATRCAYCDVVAVPEPATLLSHTSPVAKAIQIANSDSKTKTVPNLVARIRAAPEEMRPDLVKPFLNAIDQLITDLAPIGAATNPLRARLGDARELIAAAVAEGQAEPTFVGVTQRYFLGHTAFAQLEDTHLFPTAAFRLVLAREIVPWTGAAAPTRMMRDWYPDADPVSVAGDADYLKIARMWDNEIAWTRMRQNKVGGNQAHEALEEWNNFQRYALPLMPWALCVVWPAMYAAFEANLPPLYYCFLKDAGQASQADGFPSPATLQGTMHHARGAVLVAQSALLRKTLTSTADRRYNFSKRMSRILRLFYPKAEKALSGYVQRATERITGPIDRLLVYVPDAMRYVTFAIVKPFVPETVIAVNTKVEKAIYMTAFGAANRAFQNLVLPGDTFHALLGFGIDIPEALTAAKEQIELARAAFQDKFLTVISAEAGATGIDYANYQSLALLTPPKSRDNLQQLLGRIRRMQGLCRSDTARVSLYVIVCDTFGGPVELGDFKTLARPVSASQLYGAAGTTRAGGLTAPMTAWDVISRAATGPPATDDVSTMHQLDFVGQAARSRDCATYLRLVLDTYNWKRVVDSAAHSFGVIGPRDMDLGAAGDTVYYQCLADTLDTDLGRALGNVLAMRKLKPHILLSEKSSEGISLQILYNHDLGGIWNQNLIALNTTEYFIILGGQPPIGGEVWPPPDEASAVVAFLLGDDHALEGLDWEQSATDAIGHLRALMMALRGGPSSLFENNHRRCGEVTSAGNTSTFTGDFKDTAEIPSCTPAVEADANMSMEYDDAMFREVATGTQDPQILWLWSARRALEASAVGTALCFQMDTYAAIRTPGTSLQSHIINVLNDVVEGSQKSLYDGVNPDAGDMQIIPADKYLQDVPTTVAEFTTILESVNVVPPEDDEPVARARVMHEMATGQVVCAFFCESDAIRPPCRTNRPYGLQAACTQIRAARDHPTAEESESLIAQWRASAAHDAAYPELAASQHNVFSPVIVGANPESWGDRIVRWAESIVQPPQEPEPRAVPESAQRFPVLYKSDTHRADPPPPNEQRTTATT